MTALLIGAALAVAALLYVLFPLFTNAAPSAKPSRTLPADAPETAIDALREIEFDRATGKLSDVDYASLKAEYTRTALVELRSREGPPSAAVATPNVDGLDAAEAAVLRYRSMRRECDTCGPRPEPDPVFCSNCGKYLQGKCSHCGATVDAPASRFCANCGSSLAA
jgi:double zinc ribbon protein